MHVGIVPGYRLASKLVLGILLLLPSSRAFGGGVTLLGPTPYLSTANSPFLTDK